MGPPVTHYIAGRRPPALKPETYGRSADWDEYLCHFKVCLELGKWDKREKALTLSASLSGAACTFFFFFLVWGHQRGVITRRY